MHKIAATTRGYLQEKIDDIFFAPAGEVLVKLYRAACGVALLMTLLSWVGSFRWFFAPDGYVSPGLAQTLNKYQASWLNLFSYEFFQSYAAAIALFILLVLSAVALVCNWRPKIAAPLAMVLFLSFTMRNPALSYGGTDVLQFMLTGAWLLSLPGFKPAERWPIILLQVQFAVLYFTAGISKVQTADWYNGTKMFAVLSDPNFSYIPPEFVPQTAGILLIITWFGFISELMFAFLIWSKGTRKVALGTVVALHVGILVTMNVHLFSETILLGLTALLTQDEAKRLLKRLGAAKTRVVSVVRRAEGKIG